MEDFTPVTFVVPTYQVVLYFVLISLFLTKETCAKLVIAIAETFLLVVVTVFPPVVTIFLGGACGWLYYMVRFVLIYNIPGFWWWVCNIGSLIFVDIHIKTVAPYIVKFIDEGGKEWSKSVMVEFRYVKRLWRELFY